MNSPARNARCRGSGPPPARRGTARVEGLEERLLLAIFEGTPGADVITVDIQGLDVFVTVNTQHRTSRDYAVVINTLGGNDAVTIGKLSQSAHEITLNLGDGDDQVANRSDNPNETFTTLAYGMTIVGGAGTDTLTLSNILGTEHTLSMRDGSAGAGAYGIYIGHTGAPAAEFAYDATLERVNLDGSNEGELILLKEKPPGTRALVNAAGGDDILGVGGGDLVGNGWLDTVFAGGAGQDYIEFADTGAYYDAGVPLNVAAGLVTKGAGARVEYVEVETQDFRLAGAAPGPAAPDDRIDFVSMDDGVVTTTIYTDRSRRALINLGVGDVGLLRGRFDVVMGLPLGPPPSAAIYLNDQNGTTPRTYTLSPTGFTAPFPVTFTRTPAALGVNAGLAADVIAVTATDAPVTARGGGGDDRFTLGSGDVAANLRAAVWVVGEAGAGDVLEYDNTAKGQFLNNVLDVGTYVDGLTHRHETTEIHRFFQPAVGGSRLDFRGGGGLGRVVGGAGDDAVFLGVGSLAAVLAVPMTFEGSGGYDQITMDDRTGSKADTYHFNAAETFVKNNSATDIVTTTGVESRTLYANRGGNTINVNETSSDLTIYAGEGDDTVLVPDADGLVTVDTGPDLGAASAGDVLSVNADFAAAGDRPATVRVATNDRLYGLTLRPQGKLRISSGAALLVNHDLTLAGAVDLAGGTLIVDGTASIRHDVATDWVKTGRGGGTWKGTSPCGAGAINSSLAAASPLGDGVGFARALDLFAAFPGTFGGHPVTQEGMVFRYTLAGDFTLDQRVDVTDLLKLGQNYNASGKFYFQGDDNYDGAVGVADLLALGQNYNTSAPIVAPAATTFGAASAPVASANPMPSPDRPGRRRGEPPEPVFAQTPLV
jgi:hypothetical protein